MLGIMSVMVTSWKRTYANTAVSSAPDPAGHCQPTPPLEAAGRSQAWLARALVGQCSSLPAPGAQALACALQRPVSPVLWQLHSQAPLASKVKSPGCPQRPAEGGPVFPFVSPPHQKADISFSASASQGRQEAREAVSEQLKQKHTTES